MATELLIKERSREYGSVIDEAPSERDALLRERQNEQGVLKNYLAGLAATLCTNMEDKVRAASV